MLDQPITPLAASNTLADLAARIRAFHEATVEGLRQSVTNGIAAGELLLEAKAQLKHGQWLPWLRDNVNIAARTAQLYMRLAKNRAEIEAQAKSATVADMTLNEAAALLMLSSDVRKLLNFARELEHLSGEELIQRCIEEGVGVIHDLDYDPFAGRTEAERVEWLLYILFQCFDRDAGQGGGEPERVSDYVEWVLQRPFQNVSEWIGEEGDKWRKTQCMIPMPEKFKNAWAKYRDQRSDWTLAQATEKFTELQRKFEQEKAEGKISVVKPIKRRPR